MSNALSTFIGSTTTITTTLSETAANSGWKASYDPTNLLNNYLVVQIDDGSGASSGTQYASITGLPRLIKSGTTTYYQVICPDGLIGSGVSGSAFKVVANSMSGGTADGVCTGSLSTITIGGSTVGGSASFQWTVGVGSLTAGNLETFTIKVMDYYDPSYFTANGNGGPNAAQLGSSFVLKFNK